MDSRFSRGTPCRRRSGRPDPRSPDTVKDALRVGLYMVRGPAATSRLLADPVQERKVRYLSKGTVPGHGEARVSSGHPDCDCLEKEKPVCS